MHPVGTARTSFQLVTIFLQVMFCRVTTLDIKRSTKVHIFQLQTLICIIRVLLAIGMNQLSDKLLLLLLMRFRRNAEKEAPKGGRTGS